MNMKNIWILIQNTLKVTFRKKSNYIIYLLLPILGVLLSMLIYSGAGTSQVNIAITDKDAGRMSADFINDMKERDNFKIYEIDESDIRNGLLDRKYDAAIVIPQGFELGIYKGTIPKIELVSLKGQESTAWIESFINLYSQNLSSLYLASNGDRGTFDKMYANYREGSLKITVEEIKDIKTDKSTTVSSMGFLIMFTMLGTSFTTQFILNEKRSRTYFRICSAPVSFKEYIAANTLTSLIIVSLQIIMIQLVMKYIFRLETFVPDLLMFLILFLFGLVAIGINMLITALSSSSYMASTISTLVMTPTCMLGGCFWPVEFMPEIMRKIAFFMPQWWTLDAIRKIQIGGSFETISMHLMILAAFTAALLLGAIYRVSRTNDLQKFV